MDRIIKYIREKYRPIALIVYGSYADGSNNAHSDFDALAITESGGEIHDTGFADGVQLDLFAYPSDHFAGDFDPDEILQIADGQILWDTDGLAEGLMAQVRQYIAAIPRKPVEELEASVSWCEKMLLRARRQDPEGLFRQHWLTVDSLEIFCGLKGRMYRGPKKALRWMEAEEPEAFALYSAALREPQALEEWVHKLRGELSKII